MKQHGMSQSSEWRSWSHMKARCYNSKQSRYADYGGRGITVCDEWRKSFIVFYEYVGAKPGPSYSIDRINNDGNYEPGNVQWATKTQQNANQRMRKDNRSGIPGVYLRNGRWRVQIRINRKRYSFGQYATLAEASKIYKHKKDKALSNILST